MLEDLYISSLEAFEPLISELLDCQQPASVVEIGVESGGFSRELSKWCLANEAHLTCIDPSCQDGDWWQDQTHVTRLFVHSLDAGIDLSSADAVILDGDHNWFTVTNELQRIYRGRTAGIRLPLVILHDIGWPCGLRDFYYDPSQIPDWALKPCTWDRGVEPGNAGTIEGGLRGCGGFALALTEGGEENGVLTAVTDFLKQTTLPLHLWSLEAFLGLGVLFDQRLLEMAPILQLYDSPFLKRLEANRLRNWCALVRLQDSLEG